MLRVTRIPRDKKYHEHDCADLYVALRRAFGGIGDFPWQAEEVLETGPKTFIRPDRSFTLFGKRFYIEMERGTQTINKIRGKINAYMLLPHRFHVIFVVKDYQPNYYQPIKRKAEQAGREIHTLLKELQRANQFCVSEFPNFVSYTDKPCLLSSLGATSFQSIT